MTTASPPTSRPLRVDVRYFASLREQLGAGETLEVPAGLTLAALRQELRSRSAAHAAALDPARFLRCALNQELCDEGRRLEADAEVAFFPPVTGG